MDIITHILAGTTSAQALVKRSRQARSLGLAVLLGCALPDIDVVLLLISDEAFGRYHRVVPNSLVGALAISLVAGSLAWAIGRLGGHRRLPLGWIPGVSRDATEPASWRQCWAFAAWGVGTHLILDWITGWGMWPFWPWSDRDYYLGAVSSFDGVILAITLAWWAGLHIRANLANRSPLSLRRTVVWATLGYAVIMALYVSGRVLTGASEHW